MSGSPAPWMVLTGCVLLLMITGCTTLGPDFKRPDAPQAPGWQTSDEALTGEPATQAEWWKVFSDPVLDELIETAHAQNLPLQIAGLRILEARARLGIARGNRYPQLQQASGSVSVNEISQNSPNFNPAADDEFTVYQLGFDAAWELDFWGRFRRGIESADANLSATVADYDNALVSLTAEVARTYVAIRTLEERLQLARANIALQEESLRIATVRFRNGATSELDVQQASSNLANTRALVPTLQKALRQANNGLSVLLGMPPSDLSQLLGSGGSIPTAPVQVAAGVPADLLRRRPDVQAAELLAAGQSALVGVAQSDLYPRFSLLGSIGLQTSDTGSSSAGDLFDADSLVFSAGPAFSWNILNYGRIRNNVRVQDARLQQALVNYRNTVLTAYQEVEDAMVAFVQSQRESGFRATGAQAAKRSSELANIQYREGSVDFQRVVDSERFLVAQQDRWTAARGDVALNLIVMFKALGGGWEIREGREFVSEENRSEMAERTNWGKLLKPEAAK